MNSSIPEEGAEDELLQIVTEDPRSFDLTRADRTTILHSAKLLGSLCLLRRIQEAKGKIVIEEVIREAELGLRAAKHFLRNHDMGEAGRQLAEAVALLSGLGEVTEQATVTEPGGFGPFTNRIADHIHGIDQVEARRK